MVRHPWCHGSNGTRTMDLLRSVGCGLENRAHKEDWLTPHLGKVRGSPTSSFTAVTCPSVCLSAAARHHFIRLIESPVRQPRSNDYFVFGRGFPRHLSSGTWLKWIICLVIQYKWLICAINFTYTFLVINNCPINLSLLTWYSVINEDTVIALCFGLLLYAISASNVRVGSITQ